MKPRACLVVSSEMTVRAFMLRQIAAMRQVYDVTVVLNAPGPALAHDVGPGVTIHPLPIRRAAAPLSDLRCLLALIRLLRVGRFALVHSMTPKAGLLAMLAGWIARVPARVHTFTGQVWATRSGPSRLALRWCDRVVAACATATLADSASQRAFLIAQGVVRPARMTVPGHGSVCGVDAAVFRPDASARREVRASLGLAGHETLLLFIGRLHRDKGVLDLAQAFRALAERRPDVHLLAVGPDEQRLTPELVALCGPHQDRLHLRGYTDAPARYMAAADVLCLPSYREGFGSVIIEAAAAGLPAVASRIYGVVDAVVDGVTGLLHEPGDVPGLTQALDRLAGDHAVRQTMGRAARERARRDFHPDAIVADVLALYAGLPGLARAAQEAQAAGAAMPPAGGWYRRHGKRALDVLVALVALILLLPVLGAVALLVRLRLGAPVLFRQIRPGLGGRPFTLVKFRTMADSYGVSGHPLPDADRVTGLGRFLRAASLDELPELWNVLRGDMSLVGPRPLLTQYLALYSPRQARRHEVRPGITGLAQVSGRNALAWPERFELDVTYVERCSLWLDLVILGRTLVAVAGRRGIAQPGRATVDYFEGNAVEHG